MLAALVLAAGMLAAPAPAPAAGLIGPGARLTGPAGCTMNFIFTDGDRMYVGTAGHCTSTVGQRASAATIGEFGTVVYRILKHNDDFALIRIDRAREGHVDPTMQQWGGPSGVASSSETTVGDPIGLYGHGLLLSASHYTRTRAGVLAADDDERYIAELPAVFGDSGGPILHLPTGKALGIVSGIRAVTVPQGTLWGTTVKRALALVRNAGFDVDLVRGSSPLLA